jgi:hypothetical protein
MSELIELKNIRDSFQQDLRDWFDVNTARLRKMKGKTKKSLFADVLREQMRQFDLLFLFEAIVQVHPILTKRVDA